MIYVIIESYLFLCEVSVTSDFKGWQKIILLFKK